MIKEGALDDIEEIYGLHNAPCGLEGTASVWPNDLLAGVTDVEIKVKRECADSDPLTAACMIHTGLHTIKSLKVGPHDKLVFTICEFLAGSGYLSLP